MKQRDVRLDYIRVIAIWIIINFHFCTLAGLDSSPFMMTANGGWGCPGTTVFFVLSGFLLRGKYKEVGSVKEFYLKRFLAIFPVFYIAYFIGYIYTAISLKTPFFAGNPIKLIFSVMGIDNYLGYYGIGTYYIAIGEWFTAVIIGIYIIYPFFVRLYNRSKLLTSLIVYGVYIANVYLRFDPVIVDASVFSGFAMFYTGMLLADAKGILQKGKLIGASACVVSILLMLVKLPGPYIIYLHLLGICLFVGMYFVFGYLQSFEKLGRGISFLSAISYAAYICHRFILANFVLKYLAAATGFRLIAIYAVYMATVVIVSVLLYKLSGKIVSGINKRNVV